MKSVNELGGYKKIGDLFLGRREALTRFDERRAYGYAQNGVYYYGQGGMGKTWILGKIVADSAQAPQCVASGIIDLADTENHSLRGLQGAIKACLRAPEAFLRYEATLAELDATQARGALCYPGSIARLEERTARQFLEGCQQATDGRRVLLGFDSLERVPLHAGRWLLSEFLPQVRGATIALAGRPGALPATLPETVLPYEVRGWELDEAAARIRQTMQSASEEMVQSIWTRTQGSPLLIDLILDLADTGGIEHLVGRLGRLSPGEDILADPQLGSDLMAPLAQPSKRNALIWAMALLGQRFDLPVMRYLLDQQWMGLKASDYDAIVRDLYAWRYTKASPEARGHLLSDELRRMVAQWVLPRVLDSAQRKALLDLIVKQYYPQAAAAAGPALGKVLRAEQLGYILDRDPGAGRATYEAYRAQAEREHDYELEELAWAQMSDHLSAFVDLDYAIGMERGDWLRRHNRMGQAEEQYVLLARQHPEQQMEISQSLGLLASRKGDFDKARRAFADSLAHVPDGDNGAIAVIENGMGQMEERAGQWNQAFEHYARSFRAAIDAGDEEHMVSVRINRSYLYSLQGFYDEAKKECDSALDILESLPETPENTRRAVMAWRNLGIAHRHMEEFEAASSHYHQSLTLAEQLADQETICHVMQHVGINLHLWGRKFRRDRRRMTTACQYQREAWRYLTRALDMARKSDWLDAIAHGLNRLAKVYRETYRLQTLGSGYTVLPDVAKSLADLEREIRDYDVPFEAAYQDQYLFPGSFAQLDWLGKAARLFELSALVSKDANHYRRALDSLTEFATLLLEFKRFDLTPQVISMIRETRGYDYDEGLFGAMCDILQGDCYCEQGEYGAALEAFKTGYTHLAKKTGYASYVLNDRLWNLAWRFREQLPKEIIPLWCDVLEAEWLAQNVLTRRPDLLRMLENFRMGALHMGVRSD